MSCEEEKNEPAAITEINFDITRSNSDNNYSSSAEKIVGPIRKESRFHYGIDSVELIQEISFDILLENNDTLSFGFWLIKREDRQLINLGPYDPVYNRGEEWDYINFSDEVENFYYDFKEARILLNNNVIFQIGSSDNLFKVVNAREVLIEGEKKTYLEVNFEGTAYGWYDPSGIAQEVFKISKGVFKGVIE